MCVCDPNIRTPYCGRGNCVPPPHSYEEYKMKTNTCTIKVKNFSIDIHCNRKQGVTIDVFQNNKNVGWTIIDKQKQDNVTINTDNIKK